MSLRPTTPAQMPPLPMAARGEAVDGLAAFRRGILMLLALCFVIQLVAFGDARENWNACLLAFASSVIGLAYSLDAQRFRFQPISALILMFYTLTATAGALIVKTVERAALSDRLQVPELTFMVLLVAQLTLIAADLYYVRSHRLQAFRSALARRVFARLGLIVWPSDLQLWVLGGIGFFALAVNGTSYESEAAYGMGAAGQKFIYAFQFLKYAPFLIPFRAALSGVPSAPPLSYLPMAGWFMALVGLSFATNSRSTFADALPVIGMCMLVAAAFGKLQLSKIPKSSLIFWGVIAALLAFLLSRVALAMVVVRDYRSQLDAASLVSMTLEAMTNSEWLAVAQAKIETTVYFANYSEDYVNSRFFSRFLLTKFHDNMLYYLSLFGDDARTLFRGFLVQRIESILPDPVLRVLGISLNKEELVFSNGDFIVYLIDGWGLGAFKTGSMMAEIWGVFGWWFPIPLFLVAVPLYLFYDAFVDISVYGLKALSPLVLLLSWNLCGTTMAFGLGAESIVGPIGGILRGIPQNIMIYLIAVIAVTRLLPDRR